MVTGAARVFCNSGIRLFGLSVPSTEWSCATVTFQPTTDGMYNGGPIRYIA